MDGNADWVQDVRRWCATGGPAAQAQRDAALREPALLIDVLRDQHRPRRLAVARKATSPQAPHSPKGV